MPLSPTGELQFRWDQACELLSSIVVDLRRSESTRNASVTLILHNEASIVGCTFPSDIRLPFLHSDATTNSRCTSSALVQKGSDIPTTLLHVPASWGSDTLKYINGLSVVALRKILGIARDHLKAKKFEWPQGFLLAYQGRKDEEWPKYPIPGRKSCGRKVLALITRLCLEIDGVWDRAIFQALGQQGRSAIVKQISCNKGIKKYGGDYKRCGKRQRRGNGCGTDEEFPRTSGVSGLTNFGGSTELTRNKMGFQGLSQKKKIFSDVVASAVRLSNAAPMEARRTSIPEADWSPLSVLLATPPLPLQSPRREWIVHPIPADGKCLFSSVLVSAFKRNAMGDGFGTVKHLRGIVGSYLSNLAQAGSRESRFRREWLMSCIPEIPNEDLRTSCTLALALSSSLESAATDVALKAARIFISRWASCVRGDYWGGMFSVEFSILAAIFGAAIEVMRYVPASYDSVHNVDMEITDKLQGKRTATLTRQALYLPFNSTLPVLDNGTSLVGSYSTLSHSGWVDTYPVIRIVRRGWHYDACVFHNSSKIPSCHGNNAGGFRRVELSVLPEPFSSISGVGESAQFTRGMALIQGFVATRERQDKYDVGCADTVLSGTHPYTLRISDLVRLRPYDLS